MIVVDRIEDGIAVLYCGNDRLDIPLSELPAGVHEGCVLIKNGDSYAIDEAAEAARRSMIAEKAKKLFRKRNS